MIIYCNKKSAYYLSILNDLYLIILNNYRYLLRVMNASDKKLSYNIVKAFFYIYRLVFLALYESYYKKIFITFFKDNNNV